MRNWQALVKIAIGVLFILLSLPSLLQLRSPMTAEGLGHDTATALPLSIGLPALISGIRDLRRARATLEA